MQPSSMRLSVRQAMVAVAISTLVLGGIASGLQLIRRKLESRLFILNQSGQAISWIEVSPPGSLVKFRGVPEGSKASSLYEVRGDGGFFVRGRLADGTEIGGPQGYGYATGTGERTWFVVKPGGSLEFTQSHE